MRVLIVGAGGFIGRALGEALADRGDEIYRSARTLGSDERTVVLDLAAPPDPRELADRLRGIEVVINAAGILRESAGASFEAIHDRGPRALFQGCVEAGVRRIVQISALGADGAAISRFHRSKRAADLALAALPLRWVIVQPSIVIGPRGASARLLTTLAALPLIPLPGEGAQRLQPVHIDDLVEALVRVALDGRFDGHWIPAVGSTPVTLRSLLATLRAQMALGPPRFVSVPRGVVRTVAALGDWLPGRLLDRETLGMLERGNVAPAGTIGAVLGRPPRGAAAMIARSEAPAWAATAQLGWLLPLLRASVATVWIVSGLVSLGLYPVADSYALLGRVGLSGAWAVAALYGSALLDLALGAAIYLLRDRRWLWRLQAALIGAYSVIVAIWLPEQWLHPFAPMVKNLSMLAAIVALHELERTGRRWTT